jgi:CBS domain-containing protein
MGLLRLTHERPEVAKSASVATTVRVMNDSDVGAIAIKDGKKIAGIFTERDLLKRVVAQGRDPNQTPITSVMTTALVTVLDSTSVANAAALMRTHRIRHLIIVDANGDYLGMLAQRHLLYDLLNDLALKVDDLTGYLMADSPGG